MSGVWCWCCHNHQPGLGYDRHEEGMEAVYLGGGLRIWYGEVREGIKYCNQTATFTTL